MLRELIDSLRFVICIYRKIRTIFAIQKIGHSWEFEKLEMVR